MPRSSTIWPTWRSNAPPSPAPRFKGSARRKRIQRGPAFRSSRNYVAPSGCEDKDGDAGRFPAARLSRRLLPEILPARVGRDPVGRGTLSPWPRQGQNCRFMDKPSAGVRSACAICAMLPLFIPNPAAAVDLPSTRELAELSLEQLSNLEVTSVSKKPERLADAPASVFVITADDIRRSGVTSLPEALRLAPNLQVAQVSASAYNIRARGINNTTANKLLVLVDGRSVYSPVFSGVFWDVQNVMLEDIERIEVISGPGGTLWGVNAVNGVINVITKSSRATRGGLLAAGGGNRSAEAALRYGGDLGAGGSFRVYGRDFDRNHSSTPNGVAMPDGWYKTGGGLPPELGAAPRQGLGQGQRLPRSRRAAASRQHLRGRCESRARSDSGFGGEPHRTLGAHAARRLRSSRAALLRPHGAHRAAHLRGEARYRRPAASALVGLVILVLGRVRRGDSAYPGSRHEQRHLRVPAGERRSEMGQFFRTERGEAS